MKVNTTISVLLITACSAAAQSPQIIQNTKAKLESAQQTWNAQQSVASSNAPTGLRSTNATQSGAHAVQARTPAGAAANSRKRSAVQKSQDSANAKSELPAGVAGTAAGEEKLVADARRDVNKRDPFLSPVVSRISGPGSGCTGGKRCLALDSISLRGIVKAESGMIAVVVNAANKAYFLRENDPVFNGYVAKITGDTVTFKEATQDALGHHSTRDVVKRILVPAV